MSDFISTKEERAHKKLSRIPVKIEPTTPETRKRLPKWLYRELPKASEGNSINHLKQMISDKKLTTVCEEASCPNLSECYQKGTATFMIMGADCTRRCTFCDVGHGRPKPLDVDEPKHLAETVAAMGLRYVVITSVDRDDLRDGGAAHFRDCISAVREACPNIKVEILTPDFRGRMEPALTLLSEAPPDVFNHNLETVPRLYRAIRPGSDYQWSLDLLKLFKDAHPNIPTKSGIMLGLGETDDEVIEVMKDCRAHNIDMLTVGQYLQPTKFHAPVDRYVTPERFVELGHIAKEMGFSHVASGPLVRSSYHADQQAEGDMIG